MPRESETIECPHCGMDRPDACGHPATPAPCWSAEAQARWLAGRRSRIDAVRRANAARAAALTEKHREDILAFAASRTCSGSKDCGAPWKALEARLGVDHGTLERMRRELGLPMQRRGSDASR